MRGISEGRVVRDWLLAALIFSTLGAGLAGCVAIIQVPCLEQSRLDRARLDVGHLEAASRLFTLRNGRHAVGLSELVAQGLLEKVPRDPWGRQYRYWLAEGTGVFVSFGADGLCDEHGHADDVLSGELQLTAVECAARTRWLRRAPAPSRLPVWKAPT